MRLVLGIGALIAPVLLGTSSPAPAQDQSTGLEDLLGARAGQAEGEIIRRGFRNTGGSQGDDRSYANWWNARTRRCVVVGTANGRYVSVQATTPPDCNQSASTRPRPDYGYQPQPSERPRPGYDDGGYNGPSYRPGSGDVDLNLVCSGRGSADGRGRFGASVNVEISGGSGRIRLPGQLVPPLNSGGRDGWWELNEVSAGGNTIRASYRLNSVNKPRIIIDRRSGSISIQGYSQYSFSGDCDAANDGLRRF